MSKANTKESRICTFLCLPAIVCLLLLTCVLLVAGFIQADRQIEEAHQCLDNVELLIEEAGGYALSANKEQHQLWLDSCLVINRSTRRQAEDIKYKIKYGAEDWETARNEIRTDILQVSYNS